MNNSFEIDPSIDKNFDPDVEEKINSAENTETIKNLDSWQHTEALRRTASALERGIIKGDRRLVREAQGVVELMAKYPESHDKYYLVHGAAKAIEKQQQEREKFLFTVIGEVDGFPVKTICNFAGSVFEIEVGEYGNGYTTYGEKYPQSILRMFFIPPDAHREKIYENQSNKYFFEGILTRGGLLGVSCDILEYTRSHESSDFCGGVNFVFDNPIALLDAVDRLTRLNGFSVKDDLATLKNRVSNFLKNELVMTPADEHEIAETEKNIREKFEKECTQQLMHYFKCVEVLASADRKMTLDETEYQKIVRSIEDRFNTLPKYMRPYEELSIGDKETYSDGGEHQPRWRSKQLEKLGWFYKLEKWNKSRNFSTPLEFLRFLILAKDRKREERIEQNIIEMSKRFLGAVNACVDYVLDNRASTESETWQRLLGEAYKIGSEFGAKKDDVDFALRMNTIVELDRRITLILHKFLEQNGVDWEYPEMEAKIFIASGNEDAVTLLRRRIKFQTKILYDNSYHDDADKMLWRPGILAKKYLPFKNAARQISKRYTQCETTEVNVRMHHLLFSGYDEGGSVYELYNRISVPFDQLSEILAALIARYKYEKKHAIPENI